MLPVTTLIRTKHLRISKGRYILFCALIALTALTFAAQIAIAPFEIIAPTANETVITLHITIPQGHALYQDSLIVKSAHSGAIVPIHWPTESIVVEGRKIYTQAFDLDIPRPSQSECSLTIQYQGCALAGFCYPPTEITLVIPETHTATATPLLLPWPLFILMGIGLAFTPCMWPMLPILSGILLGATPRSTRAAFSLCLAYVFSMASTYACMGILAATLGLHLQAALQSSVIKALFCLLLIYLTMFLWEWLPFRFAIQIRWLPKKTAPLLNAIILGSLSTLVATPCLTPPLAAILSYITNTHHIWQGALSLFCLGIGLGLPLLCVGTWGGAHWLPRNGRWMQHVNTMMGALLLLLALWFIWTFLTFRWQIYLSMSMLALLSLRLCHYIPTRPQLLAIGLIISTLLYNGSSAGHTVSSTSDIGKFAPLPLAWQRDTQRPQCILFTADWCMSCKELKSQLQEPAIQTAQKSWECFVVDLTRPSAEMQRLQDQFDIYGVPTLLFFYPNGSERYLVGAQQSKDLLAALKID